uniref:Uncharacterized protein n=1 Tax=Myoviridae sp. ctNQV2 TaxID=2827683 RepID=A0A8S5RZV3_9CAUD|nr:MAG TPA: hypothetical protein [Myoviridae sp. ctNQV2]
MSYTCCNTNLSVLLQNAILTKSAFIFITLNYLIVCF